MIKENILNELNEQINKEFYSAYLYLSMATYFRETGLLGFSNWMVIQAEEELSHGVKMYDFVLNRGERINFSSINAPESDWKSTIQVIETALKHEEYVTEQIHNIVKLAEQEDDRATLTFLDWFISEQIEEEATLKNLLTKLRFINDDKSAIMLLDAELAKRTRE